MRTERAKRAHAFPEGARYYEDTGCELHAACLTCPLPVCQFDLNNDHGGLALNAEVLDRVATLMREGLSAGEIALQVGRSKRTVFRYTSAARRLTAMQREANTSQRQQEAPTPGA